MAKFTLKRVSGPCGGLPQWTHHHGGSTTLWYVFGRLLLSDITTEWRRYVLILGWVAAQLARDSLRIIRAAKTARLEAGEPSGPPSFPPAGAHLRDPPVPRLWRGFGRGRDNEPLLGSIGIGSWLCATQPLQGISFHAPTSLAGFLLGCRAETYQNHMEALISARQEEMGRVVNVITQLKLERKRKVREIAHVKWVVREFRAACDGPRIPGPNARRMVRERRSRLHTIRLAITLFGNRNEQCARDIRGIRDSIKAMKAVAEDHTAKTDFEGSLRCLAALSRCPGVEGVPPGAVLDWDRQWQLTALEILETHYQSVLAAHPEAALPLFRDWQPRYDGPKPMGMAEPLEWKRELERIGHASADPSGDGGLKSHLPVFNPNLVGAAVFNVLNDVPPVIFRSNRPPRTPICPVQMPPRKNP